MKMYKLLKDLPTFNAGDLFELREDGCLYLMRRKNDKQHWKDRVMAYHRNTLEAWQRLQKSGFKIIGWNEGFGPGNIDIIAKLGTQKLRQGGALDLDRLFEHRGMEGI